jgi:hypothetical protein
MAILKVYPVKDKLKRAIDYAINPDKTEECFYTSSINCHSVDTAYTEMANTKKRFLKQDKIQGHHYIQSFKPNEITPELCQKIGNEFAKGICGKDFEAVVATHLNKEHLHNHIVINSVSSKTGEKWQSTPKNLEEYRKISDEICKKYGLSVVQAKSKGKHYAEWRAEKNNKPTIRSQIRADIDEVVKQAYSFEGFIELLEDKGYEVKRNAKHIAIKPPFSDRFIRLKSLGESYEKAELLERIENTYYDIPNARMLVFSYKGNFKKLKPYKKHTGLQALYWRYLYEMGIVRKRKRHPHTCSYMREELIKLDKYIEQYKFLKSNSILTNNDLEKHKQEVQEKLDNTQDKKEKPTLRKEIRMCERVEKDTTRIKEKLHKIKEMESELNYDRKSDRRLSYEDRD